MARMYRPRPGIAGPALAVGINPQADWGRFRPIRLSGSAARLILDQWSALTSRSGEVTRVGR
jgi:hypothetical protein